MFWVTAAVLGLCWMMGLLSCDCKQTVGYTHDDKCENNSDAKVRNDRDVLCSKSYAKIGRSCQLLIHDHQPQTTYSGLANRRSRSSIFPLVLSAHPCLVSGSFTTLPESPTALLPDQKSMTESAVFRSIITLSTAPSTYHAIRPLVRVIFLVIVTLVAGVDFETAAKAEPSITFRVMSTSSPFGEFSAGSQTKSLFLSSRAGGRWQA